MNTYLYTKDLDKPVFEEYIGNIFEKYFLFVFDFVFQLDF
jgi:hypothetical protein